MAAITPRFQLPAHFLDIGEQRAGFVLLTAFLVTFLFIRTSARLIRSPKVTWWPGSVKTSSGLHLHHLVWGTVLMLLSGFLAFVVPDTSPTTEILAGVFGAGAALTLDEFALLVYLRDVYWAEEGRASVDAVVVAAVLGGLIVVGFTPFDLKNNTSSIETLAVVVASALALALLAILKGKHLLGLIGLFIPPASVVGVVRLASPRSPWARRFYKPGSRKLARSQARWERNAHRQRRLASAIAGAPGWPLAAQPEPQPDEVVDRDQVRDG